MNKIEEIKFTVIPILQKNDVRRCGLFGSFALGEERSDSDMDFVVELPHDKSLFDLVDLQLALETSLGRKIDLITYRSLSPLLRESILKEQIPIYEKGS